MPYIIGVICPVSFHYQNHCFCVNGVLNVSDINMMAKKILRSFVYIYLYL
jgi:hypothetical protein